MGTHTLDLFCPDEINVPIEDRVTAAKEAFTLLYREGRPVVIAYSGGRDSSVVSSLALTAAREFVAGGGPTPFIIATTGNTWVENPEITRHYTTELKKMEAYGRRHGIRILTRIVQPNLASTFQVKILSGRAIPSFAGTNSDCSQDLKVVPQQSFRRRFFKQLQGEKYPEAVTCLGTRFDESERRAMLMKLRGEKADSPVRNSDHELILSPIARWSNDDVMEYIGLCASGLIETFSTFEETIRIYAHSAGTTCAVVADSILEGSEKKKKGGCGTRHGCWVCQQATDKSLENMIAFDPQYEYARGLNKLNKFIRATRYDWSMRHWVGRTILGGYINIQPDTYHPQMLRMLTRFMLQLDYDEMVRAQHASEERRFSILPVEMMIAVDALQSLNGVAAPFAIWGDFRDIFQRGVRYEIPDLEPVPETPIPDARFLFVGENWDSTTRESAWTGMRDPYSEALTEGSGCALELKTLRNGHLAWDVTTEQSFSVDTESAAMIAEFELDHLFRMFDQGFTPSGITSAYKWYLQYGCLNLSHSQHTDHDNVLRRTAFKDRLGLTLNYDIGRLQAMAVPFSELPDHARLAWFNKRTTQSTQTELQLAA